MITVRDLLILNLTLQIFDGLFSYQLFSLGAARSEPFGCRCDFNLGMVYGLAYKKILASILLLLIFALGHRHRVLVRNALVVTASAYVCAVFLSLWQILA